MKAVTMNIPIRPARYSVVTERGRLIVHGVPRCVGSSVNVTPRISDFGAERNTDITNQLGMYKPHLIVYSTLLAFITCTSSSDILV